MAHSHIDRYVWDEKRRHQKIWLRKKPVLLMQQEFHRFFFFFLSRRIQQKIYDDDDAIAWSIKLFWSIYLSTCLRGTCISSSNRFDAHLISRVLFLCFFFREQVIFHSFHTSRQRQWPHLRWPRYRSTKCKVFRVRRHSSKRASVTHLTKWSISFRITLFCFPGILSSNSN